MQKKLFVTFLVAGVGLSVAFSAFALPNLLNRVDFVNIGDVNSETGHNLAGWGPVEPSTNGGNWGEIGNDVLGTDCDLADGQICDAVCRVAYSATEPDSPDNNGRSAYLTLNKNKGWGPKEIKMRVLDGIADDDFMVFIKNKKGNWVVLADEYNSDPSATEVWKVHTFALPFSTWNNKPIELRIMATASDWNQKATYGQLGVDWIELLGPGRSNGK